MSDALWSVILPAVPACAVVMVAIWAWDEVAGKRVSRRRDER